MFENWHFSNDFQYQWCWQDQTCIQYFSGNIKCACIYYYYQLQQSILCSGLPVAVVLIPVGIVKAATYNLRSSFELISARATASRNEFLKAQPATNGMMLCMHFIKEILTGLIAAFIEFHNNTLKLFVALELSYMLVLQNFINTYGVQAGFSEKWLRYICNGGRMKMDQLFRYILDLEQSLEMYKELYYQVNNTLSNLPLSFLPLSSLLLFFVFPLFFLFPSSLFFPPFPLPI